MLSIDHCRKYLGNSNLSDDEVAKIRDSLYEAAQIAYDAQFSDTLSGSNNPFGLLQDNEQNHTV